MRLLVPIKHDHYAEGPSVFYWVRRGILHENVHGKDMYYGIWVRLDGHAPRRSGPLSWEYKQ